MLFAISGYIFAMQDWRPYGLRIQRRAKGLMIPYFVWSALGLLLTYLLQRFPVTAEAVRASQLDQLGDNRPYEQIGIAGMLYRWLIAPVSFQLWFLRSLFIYNLLYPLIKKIVLTYPVIWFSLLSLLWWVFFSQFFIESQSLLFFSAGIWLCKTKFAIERKPVWLSTTLCWLIFIGLSVIKTFMAFEFEETTDVSVLLFSFLHMMTATAGIAAVWYSGDAFVHKAMSKNWLVTLTGFSFIIYAMHVPLLPYITRLLFMLMHGLPYYRLLTYLLAALLVFLICIGTGALLRRLAPRLYVWMTGGRGF